MGCEYKFQGMVDAGYNRDQNCPTHVLIHEVAFVSKQCWLVGKRAYCLLRQHSPSHTWWHYSMIYCMDFIFKNSLQTIVEIVS